MNSINEELAKIILNLDEDSTKNLYEYLQLQTVPDNFPIAKHANLFFMLNPDNFVVNELGPDVMTYSHVEIDPKISEIVPELSEIYQRWLLPIQTHHAAFSTMEGIAEFAVQNILQDDDVVLLLPENPSKSAKDLQSAISANFQRDIALIVTDSMTRPFRSGVSNFALASANIPSLIDLKGDPDIYGNILQSTEIAIADELAAAAGLLMGQGSEKQPVVIIKGFDKKNYSTNDAFDLVVDEDEDLYR